MTTWTDYRTTLDKELDEYLGAPWESFGVAEVMDAMRTLGHINEVNAFRAYLIQEGKGR